MMMKKKTSNLCRLLAIGVGAAILATGCRKPKLDLSGLRDVPMGPNVSAAGTQFEPLDPLRPGDLGTGANTPGAAGWQDPNKPFAMASGTKGTIKPADVRWSDVVVYFAYDSAAIGPAERPKLETLSRHLKEHANYSIVIEGHCDERGSDEYNRALGETRALVVRDYLMSLGIDGARMETVSYGEDRPVAPNAQSEAEHQQNRRAEFIIGVRQ